MPPQQAHAASPPAGPLRIGLLLGSLEVPAWVVKMVEQIQQGGHSQIALLVLDGSQRGTKPSLVERLREGQPHLLSRVCRALLRRAIRSLTEHRPRLPSPFIPTSLAPLVEGVPTVTVLPGRTQWSDRFSEAELQAIRAHDIDVFVRIGFRILRGGILTAARHGVWSFHHGDNSVNRGGPPGWWESMQAWPLTGCTLQVLSEDLDNGLVLDRTWTSTDDASVLDTNARNYWKALGMIPRQLARLHRQGPEPFFAAARQRQAQPQIYGNRLYRDPTSPELLALLLRRAGRRVQKIVSALTHYPQWILMVQPSASLSMSLWRFKRLVPPPDRFWADPFLLEHQGRTWLYFEELPFCDHRGRIVVAELSGSGSLGEVQPALVEPHHLSYPFVFEHEGEVYMIPESCASRRVTLYRCVEMPARWEKLMDLMSDVEMVDTTLLRHGGRWWLIGSRIPLSGVSSNDELHIYWADDFRSTQWTPHPMNPVVSDARMARPAGRIFEHQGQLIRPSQDCSHHYGWAFQLNLIERLDTEGFAERLLTRAEPNWAPDVLSTHSFARSSGFTVIDAEVSIRANLASVWRQFGRWMPKRRATPPRHQ